MRRGEVRWRILERQGVRLSMSALLMSLLSSSRQEKLHAEERWGQAAGVDTRRGVRPCFQPFVVDLSVALGR